MCLLDAKLKEKFCFFFFFNVIRHFYNMGYEIQKILTAILLVVLRIFLWKPFLKIIDERNKKIKLGLEAAEQASLQASESQSESKKILDDAKKEASQFVNDAREMADKLKVELEENAMAKILGKLPQPIQDNYHIIWDEYQRNTSRESRFVHEIDKLEMALQAKIYEKDFDAKKIQPFIISTVEQIHDDDLKKILSEIIQ